LSALLWKAPEPVIPSPLITAIADTPFYKVKPSLPPLPAESKKLSRRADAVPWPQKQKPPAFIKWSPGRFQAFGAHCPFTKDVSFPKRQNKYSIIVAFLPYKSRRKGRKPQYKVECLY
jgi:hypothetical protein